MKTDTLLVKQFGENGFKHMSASEVLANLPSSKGLNFSSAELQKKIDKLQKDADYQMALETFLDCNYTQVKKTKRVYGLPKKYRQEYIMGYTIYIYKKDRRVKINNLRLVRVIRKDGYSGNAMMDIMPDYRKQYPESKGFVVDWSQKRI